MGRMKDIHIDMLNAGWEGDPNEYLKIRTKELEDAKSDILCPNCLVDMLIQESQEDLSCIHCGFDFYRINHNTVKYK